MKRFLVQLIILFCALFLLKTGIKAQNSPGSSVTVQGRVLDQKKKPVYGVTVAEVDAEQRIIRAVSTDVEGNFVIRISDKADSLSFSYIGNESIKQPIGN